MRGIRAKVLSIMFAATLLLGCEDEKDFEQSVPKSLAKFRTVTQVIDENGADGELRIKLTPPAARSGEIVIKGQQKFATIFTTTPAATDSTVRLTINKGDSVAVVKIKPINNTTYSGDRVVRFFMYSASADILKQDNVISEVIVKDDETSQDPEEIVESIANFTADHEVLEESNQDGLTYQIAFSHPVAVAGQVKVTFSAEGGALNTNFAITPQPQGNVIILDVEQGATTTSFKVTPVSNSVLTGDINLGFIISHTSGSISKGLQVSRDLVIQDDELKGLPKGYETRGLNDFDKKSYTYDEHGRIKQVSWEKNVSAGTDTYYYNQIGQLIKINKAPGTDVHYEWADNQIQRMERKVDGVVKEYSEFEYDEYGNVAATVSWHRQSDGSFGKGFTVVYLYFLNGNLYKSLVYNDGPDPEEPQLVATRTYDNYNDIANLFPVNIVPGVKAQSNLPHYHSYEQNNTKIEFEISYDYDGDGKVTKRTSRSGPTRETTFYYYY